MRHTGKALGAILCGVVLSMGLVWLVRLERVDTLELRPGPQSGVKFSVLDRGKVNINLANQEQLETLPGIGPELAAAIVEHRESNGYFEYPEHLIEVPGISKTMMETLLDLIAV